MKNKNIVKMSAMILASSISFGSSNVKAAVYDKDEVLEQTIENYRNGDVIPSSVSGTIDSSDYPIGNELFVSDDSIVKDVLTDDQVGLGDIVIVNGYGRENSFGKGNVTCYCDDKLMAVVGIKSDREYPYALASIDDGDLGDIVGWFKMDSIKSGCKKTTYTKHADVLRKVVQGVQSGFLEEDGKIIGDPRISLPKDYLRLDGSENCRYGVKTTYEIPKELMSDDTYYNHGLSSDNNIETFSNCSSDKFIELNYETGLCTKTELDSTNDFGKVDMSDYQLQLKYGIKSR